MSNEEKVEILKKYFMNKRGSIDLSGIDFGDMYVDLSFIKAQTIDNACQKASGRIYNNDQEAKEIIKWL